MTSRHGESRSKRRRRELFYWTLSQLTDIDIQGDAGDFRLVDRAASDACLRMRERNRYLRGMFSWVGFEQQGVPYTSPPRAAGRRSTRFGRWCGSRPTGSWRSRIGRCDWPSTSASSSRSGDPVRALGSRLKLLGVFVVPGWTSVMVLVGVVGGVQLIVMGIIGEYVGRIADEVKQRPLYVVRAVHGAGAGAGAES